MSDVGLTHIALPCTDPRANAAVYRRFADMEVVHQRTEPGGNEVLWISDRTRPFVVVLLPVAVVSEHVDHLGVGCASRAEVGRRLSAAALRGFVVDGPHDEGPPVGYWGTIKDPDGHVLELAYGQVVALTLAADAPSGQGDAPVGTAQP